MAIESEALQLFVERARAVRHDFALTADMLPTVIDICRRLDGLPLAVGSSSRVLQTLEGWDYLAAQHGLQWRAVQLFSVAATFRNQHDIRQLVEDVLIGPTRARRATARTAARIAANGGGVGIEPTMA